MYVFDALWKQHLLLTITFKRSVSRALRLLIVCCLNAVFNIISVISRNPKHLSMLHGVLLSGALRIVLLKPMPAFPHNHCRNNRLRREKNRFCSNYYHQSSKRILAKPGIDQETSCCHVRIRYRLRYGLGDNIIIKDKATHARRWHSWKGQSYTYPVTT